MAVIVADPEVGQGPEILAGMAQDLSHWGWHNSPMLGIELESSSVAERCCLLNEGDASS
jgi:hypothetical protein